uniref:Fucosyltransferase n=1 Tax=Agrobacterium tumefaciens TaxID=358 RepID=A0A1W7HH38_AGRTU|nr:unnamed protein product [Agrobacterium tumefaciens]BAX36562.1 fucosyltransferase [Agrobacterium tumefaciens]
MRPCCSTASLFTSHPEFMFWVTSCRGHLVKHNRDSAVTTGSGIVLHQPMSLAEPSPAATAGISNIRCPVASSPSSAASNCAGTRPPFCRRNWRLRWKRRKTHRSKAFLTMRLNRWCRRAWRWSEMPPLWFALTPRWAFPRPRETQWRCATPCGKRTICPPPFHDIREAACRWARQLQPMGGDLPKPPSEHGSKIRDGTVLLHPIFALRLRSGISQWRD